MGKRSTRRNSPTPTPSNTTDAEEIYTFKRLFTLEQANKTLPLVRHIVDEIQREYCRLVDQVELLQRLEANGASSIDTSHLEELRPLRQESDNAKAAIIRCAQELESIGAILKGPMDGLVDFPAMHEGKIVYLCWKAGEPSIQHWHEIEAGFAGRETIKPGEFVAVEPAAQAAE